MRCLIHFLFFLIPTLVHSAPTLYISLGSHCQMAFQLNYQEVRKKSFPFDWLLFATHSELIKMLQEDFRYFFNENYLFPNPCRPIHLENPYYKIEFRHEWEFNDTEFTEEKYRKVVESSKQKYERRINRFKSLKNYPGKVIFMRVANNEEESNYWHKDSDSVITASDALELKDALRNYFPDLDFLLVVVNYTYMNRKNIQGIDQVLEFKVSTSNTFAYEEFSPLFSQLKALY